MLRAFEELEASCVIAREFAGISHLLEHLIRIGHRKIACIISYPYSRRKVALQAYKTVLSNHNIEIRDEWIEVSSLLGISAGKEAMAKLLALRERPTAVFACNDLTAIGAIHTIHRVGLRVPDDMAIVGVDNLEISEHLEVPLTTVKQPRAEMGREATRILINEIQGKTSSPTKMALECPVIVRESCGTLIAARQALHY